MGKKNKHKKNKQISEIGAPPGTVKYHGQEQTNRVKITLIEYNETEFTERDFYDLSECLNNVNG
jgi:hypothetical protein